MFASIVLSCVLVFQSAPTQQAPILESGGDEKRFVSLEAGKVSFKNSQGQVEVVSFDKLPIATQRSIMDYTGWGRVWEDASGKHHTVADLIGVTENSAILQKADGAETIVPLAKLSRIDRSYVEARRKLHTDALPDTFRAKVIGVSDGDTLTVLLNRKQYKVRVSGIDAPETGQAFGTKAKKHLPTLVFGKTVQGSRDSVDQYGRNVCTLSIDSKRVDHEMLATGLAWHYLKYSQDEFRQMFEDSARVQKLNIWSESGPIAPWEWRRWGAAKRKQFIASKTAEQSPVVVPPKSPSVETPVLSHWLNTNGNVRHNSNCRWYRNTKKGRMCGPNDGRGCKKCGG